MCRRTGRRSRSVSVSASRGTPLQSGKTGQTALVYRHRTVRGGSLAWQMATGLHFSVRRTGWAAVNDVTVVTEHAGELLGNMCTAVSTACACCRRFHGLPVVLCGFHGGGGGTRMRCGECRLAVAVAVDHRRHCHRHPSIILSRGANANKGRRLFICRGGAGAAKYVVSGQSVAVAGSCRQLATFRHCRSSVEFSCIGLYSSCKHDIDR